MGTLKLEQKQKVESAQERGQEILEIGAQKVEEAKIVSGYAGIFDQIEVIDDEDLIMAEEIRQSSDSIAGRFEGEGLGTIIICDPLPRDIEAEDFQDISGEADQINEEFEKRIEQMVKDLEDVF